MSAALVLSLFPGIGMLDHAFELEGFCVVRGPDLLWGGDIRRFHPPPARFDGVFGGPPCQAFSRLRHIVEATGGKVAENLIPEYERVVAEAAPAWFLMENVPDAPAPIVRGYDVAEALLNNRELGEEQSRQRRFSFGVRGDIGDRPVRFDVLPELRPVPMAYAPAVCASGGGSAVPVRRGGSGKAKRCLPGDMHKGARTIPEMLRLQGLPPDFDLPAFTVHGKQRAIGNGVPIPMGRAIARCVRRALGLPIVSRAR